MAKENGHRNHFYDTMREVLPGDTVFSFVGSHIVAVGMATSAAEPSPKPDFGGVGSNWANAGWLVQVEFQQLKHPVRPKSHIAELREHLPGKYSPLTASGNGLQHVYLAEVSAGFAAILEALIGPQVSEVSTQLVMLDEPMSLVEKEVAALQGRVDIPETEKRQLVNARVGQGLFKNNVRLNEHACRVTGVTQLHHLRASHIKPWRISSNEEKLHGCNGLLLAPHVDHLFDRGLISFEDSGELLVSPKLEPEVLTSWSIELPKNVGTFNVDQRHFLDYHRNQVLKAG